MLEKIETERKLIINIKKRFDISWLDNEESLQRKSGTHRIFRRKEKNREYHSITYLTSLFKWQTEHGLVEISKTKWLQSI